MYAAITDADPLDNIRAHRFPANMRRRYERLRRLRTYLAEHAAIAGTLWSAGTRSLSAGASTQRLSIRLSAPKIFPLDRIARWDSATLSIFF